MIDPDVSFVEWVGLAGALLLVLSLSSAHLRRLPVSSALLYLLVGIALGPLGLKWIRLPLSRESTWLEHVTEVAVIISLFIGGLKLRLPFSAPPWRAVLRLAGPVMVVCIGGVTLFSVLVLRFDWGTSLLLGALLAPTDPVLASAVSISEAKDEDRMRYGLSGEAGLNDGMAFPFVVFALLWGEHEGPGAWIGSWALSRLLWAIPAGLVLGFLLGKQVGQLAVHLRTTQRDASPSDFLALALIALSYVAADLIGAWGFLAVFAAGVGLRSAELAVVRRAPHPLTQTDEASNAAEPRQEAPELGRVIAHPPAEDLVAAKVEEHEVQQPAVAIGMMVSQTLTFGDTAERLLELLLVAIVGVALAEHWDPRAFGVAFVLFCVLRPLATRVLLAHTPTTSPQRWLMAWFGVRGIGSLYYLGYAMRHGPDSLEYGELIDLTLSTIALSVLLHGVSAQPLLRMYERSLERRAPLQGSYSNV